MKENSCQTVKFKFKFSHGHFQNLFLFHYRMKFTPCRHCHIGKISSTHCIAPLSNQPVKTWSLFKRNTNNYDVYIA